MRGQASVELQEPNLLGSSQCFSRSKWKWFASSSFEATWLSTCRASSWVLAPENWIPDAYRVAILGRGLLAFETPSGERQAEI